MYDGVFFQFFSTEEFGFPVSSAFGLFEEGASAVSHQRMQPGVGDSSGPLQARSLGLLIVPAVMLAPAASREEAWRAEEAGVDAEHLSGAPQENLYG